MDAKHQLDGIIRARGAAARALVATLNTFRNEFSELQLAQAWRDRVSQKGDMFPFGWYVPPPNGMSILIGEPADYGRLRYQSLRSEENWPKMDRVYSPDAILYPYCSVVDRATMMIGDHVATYYGGDRAIIKDWMSLAYAVTSAIVALAKIGMTFSELFHQGSALLVKMGARNNNFSLSGGLASDLGHTVPFFGQAELLRNTIAGRDLNEALMVELIGANRVFVGPKSDIIIKPPIAFTIEPQIVGAGLPMASFHMIVAFTAQGKTIVESFRDIFDHFHMGPWIYSKRDPISDANVIS